MFKAQRGIVLVIALVFSALIGLMFNKVSEQIIQGKRLSLGLQEQVEQYVNLVSARNLLNAYLQKPSLIDLLLGLADSVSEVSESEFELAQDFNQLTNCSEVVNSSNWYSILTTNNKGLFYLKLIGFSNSSTESMRFYFATLICLSTQAYLTDVAVIEVYQLKSNNELTRLYSEVIPTVRSDF